MSVHADDVLWWRALVDAASRPLDTAMLLATVAEVERLEQLRQAAPPPTDERARRLADVEDLTQAYDPGALRLATWMGMVAVLSEAGAVRACDHAAVLERAAELGREQVTFGDERAVVGVVLGLLARESRELFRREVLEAAAPPPAHERIEEER